VFYTVSPCGVVAVCYHDVGMYLESLMKLPPLSNVCYNVLQCAAMCCSVLKRTRLANACELQCVAVYSSLMQFDAVRCNVLQSVV